MKIREAMQPWQTPYRLELVPGTRNVIVTNGVKTLIGWEQDGSPILVDARDMKRAHCYQDCESARLHACSLNHILETSGAVVRSQFWRELEGRARERKDADERRIVRDDHLWVVLRWLDDGPYPGWNLVTWFNRAKELDRMKRAYSKKGFRIVKIRLRRLDRACARIALIESHLAHEAVQAPGSALCLKCGLNVNDPIHVVSKEGS